MRREVRMEMCSFYFYLRQIKDDRPVLPEKLEFKYVFSLDDGATYSTPTPLALTMSEEGLYMFAVPANAKMALNITYFNSVRPAPYDKYQGSTAAFHTPQFPGSYDLNEWIQNRWINDFSFDPNSHWPLLVLGTDFFWDCYSKTPNEFKFTDWVGTNIDPYEGF